MRRHASVSTLGELRTGLRFALTMLLLLGGVYAGVVALVGQVLFPVQATGSLVEVEGRVVGSSLIGQPFVGAGYFHGRPSAAGHDPMATAGSNLAPDNPALRERVAQDSRVIATREGVTAVSIPVDLLAASGSGLDPHISPAAARLQVPRVAAYRGIDEALLHLLLDQHVEPPQFRLLGQTRVNVLSLNLALDARFPMPDDQVP